MCFIGVKVATAITNRLKYRETLEQIRHYLSFQQHLEFTEDDHLLILKSKGSCFTIVKNCNYLHTSYYYVPISEEDLSFVDACYECFMILQENFPSKIKTELIEMQSEIHLAHFIRQKNQELARRANSYFKNLFQQRKQLTLDETEDLFYLLDGDLTRKNKSIALKLLNSDRVSHEIIASLDPKYIQILRKMTPQSEYSKYCGDLIQKIQFSHSFKNRQHKSNKQNFISNAGQARMPSIEPMQMNTILFQLKQTTKLQRICSLIERIIHSKTQDKIPAKVNICLDGVIQKFISNQLDQQQIYALDFISLLKEYWAAYRLTPHPNILEELEIKFRELKLKSSQDHRSLKNQQEC